MKTHFVKWFASIVAMAVGATGCSNMTPGENAALFGTVGGAAAGGIARAAGMSTGQSIATGVAAGAIIAATTYIIAKHQATERQRQLAERRARAAYQRMLAERESTRSRTTRTTRSTAAVTSRTASSKKKLPRYIAVDTEKSERTSPQASKSIMLFDTESQEVVGNNVYDVKTAPAPGETAKFETYSAEYVGSGT